MDPTHIASPSPTHKQRIYTSSSPQSLRFDLVRGCVFFRCSIREGPTLDDVLDARQQRVVQWVDDDCLQGQGDTTGFYL